MLNTFRLILVFFLLVSSSELLAEDQSHKLIDPLKTNGCGSGWNAGLVPESSPISRCNFHESCNAHDICYGKCEGKVNDPTNPECAYLRCNEGGDLYKSEECETDFNLVNLIKEARKRKSTCDDNLYKEIIKHNHNNPACKVYAWLYRFAVKRFGDGPFVGVDSFGLETHLNENDYNSAINDFLTNGTDEQFKNFAEGIEKNSVGIDMKKPLEYDSSYGLSNKN